MVWHYLGLGLVWSGINLALALAYGIEHGLGLDLGLTGSGLDLGLGLETSGLVNIPEQDERLYITV